MAQLTTRRDIASVIQTSQQKAISTGLLTLVLVAALFWGSFRPTLNTIIETSQKYKSKTIILEKFEQQNSNLTTLLSRRLELQTELKTIDFLFPYDGDYSLFVTNLNQMAKNYSFRLNSVTFSDTYFRQVEKVPSLQFSGMTPVTFQTSFTGNPERLAQFLSYVESTPFLPKVVSISYSPDRALSEKTNVSITFLLYKMSAPATINE